MASKKLANPVELKDELDYMEANWFGFFEKVKPGSRQGTGGRKQRNDPPWTIDKTVLDSLKSIRYDSKTKLTKSSVQRLQSIILKRDTSSEQTRNFFCQKIPYEVVLNFPIISVVDEFHSMKNSSLFMVCSEVEAAQCSIENLRDASNNVALIACRVTVDINLLQESLPFVHCLVLSENNLSAILACQFFAHLRVNRTLRTLSISENSLSDFGCSSIPSSLCDNPKLSALFLTANDIGDDGVKFISEALSPCRCHNLMTQAIAEDQVHVFAMLLRHGFPWDPSSSGEGLLDKAIVSGSVGIAEYLLDLRADACAVNTDSESLLSRAASLGHLCIVDLLISRKADVFQRDSRGKSVLMQASRNGQTDVLGRLIKEIKSQQMSVEIRIKSIELFAKIQRQQRSQFNRKGSLLSWFSNDTKGIENDQDSSSSQDAARVGLSILEETMHQSFLYLRFEVNSEKQAVHFTVPTETSDTEIMIDKTVAFLPVPSDSQEISVQLCVPVIDGDDLIIARGSIRFASLIFSLSKKQEHDMWTNIYDDCGGIVAMISLLATGSLPFLNECCRVGNTALIEACQKGQLESIQALVESGADVDSADRDGNTPLIISSRLGFEDSVKILLLFGANVHAANRAGVTAHIVAQHKNFTNITQILECRQKLESHHPLAIKRLHPENTTIFASSNQYQGEYFHGSFELIVVEAQNLPVADSTGFSDPFCRIILNHQQKQTRVMSRNLNPKWNQAFLFDDKFCSWEKSLLTLEVLDSNVVSMPILLGKRELKLARLMSIETREPDNWSSVCLYLDSQVEHKAGRSPRPTLHLKFRFSRRQGQYLQVGVLGAMNLPFAKARNVESCCFLQLGDAATETPTSIRTSTAKWNSYRNFSAPGFNDSLSIEVRDVYATRRGMTETKTLSRLEIPSNVLTYLLATNLTELELELYDLDGNTLIGPGGRISSLQIRLALTMYEARETTDCHRSSNFESRPASLFIYHPTKNILERRQEFPTPRSLRFSSLDTDAEIFKITGEKSIITDQLQDELGQSAVAKDARGIVLFDKDQSAFSESDLSFLSSKHTSNVLVTLNLDQNKISDAGATYLANSLQMNSILQNLSVKDNKIGVEGATALGVFLQRNSFISRFYVSKNRIKDEGLRELCRALVNNKTSNIVSFDVGDNNFGSVGMRFLARTLTFHRLLQSLSLGNNSVGPDGALLLAQGLRKNVSVKALDLSYAVLGDVGVDHIAQALASKTRIFGKATVSNKTLQTINLSGNSLSDRSIDHLIGCLRHNQFLQTIILDGNNISSEALRSLDACIVHNRKKAAFEHAIVKIQRAFRSSTARKSRIRFTETNMLTHGTVESMGAIFHENGQGCYDSSELPAHSESFQNQQTRQTLAVSPVEMGSDSQKYTKNIDANESLNNMLIAATNVAMFNLGDAVILEHEAAYALAQEAAAKLLAAAESYSRLEDHFYELMQNESSDQGDIISAVNQLTSAREEILRAIEESRLSEEAAAMCFENAEVFAICESEEAELLGAVKNLEKNEPEYPKDLTNGTRTEIQEESTISTIALDNKFLQSSSCKTNVDALSIITKPENSGENLIVEVNGAEHVEAEGFEEDWISSAFNEFFKAGGNVITREDPADLEATQLNLAKQRDSDIKSCCSIALEELEMCKNEIADLKVCLSSDILNPSSFDKLYMISSADERCSNLEYRFKLLLESTNPQELSGIHPHRLEISDVEEELISEALQEFLSESVSITDQKNTNFVGKSQNIGFRPGSASRLDQDIDNACSIIKQEMLLCKKEVADLRDRLMLEFIERGSIH